MPLKTSQSQNNKSGRIVKMPTPQKEAAIIAGMSADPDSSEWMEEDFAKAKPASEFFPLRTYGALVAI